MSMGNKTEETLFSEDEFEFKDILTFYRKTFMDGFKTQVERDSGLVAKLKAAGLKRPLRGRSFDAFIDGYTARAFSETYPLDSHSDQHGYSSPGLDAAWPLQRFKALIPTDSRRAFGDTLYFNIYDVGVHIASLIPISRYMKETPATR